MDTTTCPTYDLFRPIYTTLTRQIYASYFAGMAGGGAGQGMVGGPQIPNQGLVSQQTPALVAQLQRQTSNQQQNMMGGGQQQYNHPSQQY